MSTAVDKEIIANRFCSALKSYGREAVVQKKIARNLFGMLREAVGGREHMSIAEIGCGTGFLSRLIYENFILRTNVCSSLLLNDLCPPMKTLFEGWEKTAFVCGDAEKIFSAENKGNCSGKRFDVIATTSVIQWFEDQTGFLKNCCNHLTDNGLIALSSFGRNNFKEIRALTGVGLEYLSLEEYKQALQPCFEIIKADEEEIRQEFNSPIDILKHLKATGVNSLRPANKTENDTNAASSVEGFRWTKQRLEEFSGEYTGLFGNGRKVILTYHPVYLILKKK